VRHEEVFHFAEGLLKGETERAKIVKEVLAEKVREVV
jgi:hypothetical protein